MKILIATAGYYPAKNYGGPVVSVENFVNLLGKDFELYIVTQNCEFGCKTRLKGIDDNWNSVNNVRIKYIDPNDLNYETLLNLTDDLNPDLIYVNSFLFYKILIPFIKISKLRNIPILLAPRGELCKNALNIKKYKKIPYIYYLKKLMKNCNIKFQSTSDEEKNAIIKLLNVREHNIISLSNIPTIVESNDYKRNKEKGKLNSIFVSRIHPKKNLKFLIECLKEVDGDVCLDIYGPKEDLKYWEEIDNLIKIMPKNIKISYLGNLDHNDIIKTMSKYECFLFYTLSENYGHVIAEAINALCIPVISNTTPWNDISDYKAGFVSNLEDKNNCIYNIQSLIDMDDNQFKKYIENLKKYKDIKMNIYNIENEYKEALNKIIGG